MPGRDGEGVQAADRAEEGDARALGGGGQQMVDFTVFEMVMIGRTPHKKAFERDDENDRAIVLQAIERVGCSHLLARSFNTLSGGEKQRVLIARALDPGRRPPHRRPPENRHRPGRCPTRSTPPRT